jgi:maltose alpha-D-glucosyltransferase/alpha-amylase
VLLGEVNLPYPDTMAFYGDGRPELTMCFDFVGMQQMYLALARSDAEPLAETLRTRPVPPGDGHWATFVRNHDELTLDKLTDSQRQEVFAAFGPREEHQVYGRGLRRRLPPMLDGDPERVRTVYSLLFALPGTPVLFYGEEIGMGEADDLDDPRAEGRLAVRTVMQWESGPGGGFSPADPAAFPGPVTGGRYGPEHVNVRDQEADPDSLLAWVRGLVKAYRACPELAWGDTAVLDPGPGARPVLALASRADGHTVLTLHHLGDGDDDDGGAPVALTLPELAGRELHDVLDPAAAPLAVGDDGALALTLPARGRRWLRTR